MKFNLIGLAFILIALVSSSLQQQQAVDQNENGDTELYKADSQANEPDVDMQAADALDLQSPILGQSQQIEAMAEVAEPAISDAEMPSSDDENKAAVSDNINDIQDDADVQSKVVGENAAEHDAEKVMVSQVKEAESNNNNNIDNNENLVETKEEEKAKTNEQEVKPDENLEKEEEKVVVSAVDDAAANTKEEDEKKMAETETAAENVDEEKLKKPEAIKADVVLTDDDPVNEDENNDDNKVGVVVSNEESSQNGGNHENNSATESNVENNQQQQQQKPPSESVVDKIENKEDQGTVDTSNSIQDSSNQLKKDANKAADADNDAQAKKEQINASDEQKTASSTQTAGINLLYILIPIVCGSVLVLIVVAFILRAKTNLFRSESTTLSSDAASPSSAKRAAIYKQVPQSEQNASQIV